MASQKSLLNARFQFAITNNLPLLSVSDSVEALLGFGPEDFRDGKVMLRSRIHRNDQDIADAIFADTVNPPSGTFNIRIRQADGRIRCVKGEFVKSLDEGSGTTILDLFLHDANTLQQAPRSEVMMANFKAMMENTDDFIFFKDRNHVITGASQALVAALSDPADHWTDVIGKNDYDLYPEEYADSFYQHEKQVFAGVPVAPKVQETVTKVGKRWVENRKHPVRDENGEIIGLFGIARDVTEKKLTEEALAESEKRFRSLFEQVPSVSVRGYNRDRRVIFWNPASERLFGYSRKQALGRRLEDLIVPESLHDDVVRLTTAWANGGPAITASEMTLQNADGRPVEVFSSHVMLRNKAGEPEMYSIDVDVSERKRATTALLQEKQFSRALLDSLPGIFYLYTYPECRLVLWNKQHELLLGYQPDEMAGRHVTDWHVPEAKEAVLNAVDLVMRTGQSTIEAPLVAKDGHLVYFALTGVKFAAQDRSYFMGTGADITERRRLQNAQQEALGRLQKISSRVPGVVYQFRLRPDGTSCFPFASEALREIYRLSPEEVRDDASKMNAAVHPDDFRAIQESVQKSAQDLTPWQMDYRVMFADGTVRWLSGNSLPERDDEGILWHGFITDITERKRLEEQVRQMAFYDALTELPNRRLLYDRLSQAMAASARSGCHGALMFLDLDNFKPLNDSYGHAVGDLLLIEAADRLKRCVRAMDTVARFGGDEFVVMISELKVDRAGSLVEAAGIAQKVRLALSDPYVLTVQQDGKAGSVFEHHCTASIGLNLFIGHEMTQDEIIKGADAAMYQAKEAGRNHLQIAPELPQRPDFSDYVSTDFVQLVWHSSYECGNALIDNQHRALFYDANRLIAAILAGRSPEALSTLIDVLVRDVVQHFRDEEVILVEAGFPGAKDHAAIHRQLVDNAVLLVGRFHAGTLAIGDLFQFLAHDVIARHMLRVDREFFACLKAFTP